jgi:hypothetical protein
MTSSRLPATCLGHASILVVGYLNNINLHASIVGAAVTVSVECDATKCILQDTDQRLTKVFLHQMNRLG